MTGSRRIQRLLPIRLLCATVCVVYCLPSAVPAANNLALSRPAFSSSDYEPEWAPGNAVDASQFTRWSSEFSDPQWIYVDLGAHQNIDRVRLLWKEQRADDYEIQVSSDATTWTNVFSRASAAPLCDEISFAAVNTRYVRMYGTSRVDSFAYSIWEFEVYALGAAMDALEFVSLAHEKSATVSSTESGSVPKEDAVDALVETRWASAHSDPQWIYVDLGSVTTIDLVEIVWEVSRARAFEIQVSTDTVTWTNVYSGTDASATYMGSGKFHDYIPLSTVNTRYVRMYGTERTEEPFGYSIWEFIVHNIPEQPTGLTATPLSGSEIALTWTDTSDNEDNFKIRRSVDGTNFYSLAPLFASANTTNITDSGLIADTTYYYKIRSENIGGESPYTDPPTSGATHFVELPATPTGLVATAVAQTQIDLTWTDVATNELYYKAYRSPDGVTGWARIDPDGGLPADTEIFSDTNCAVETTYYYHVRCINVAGNSPYSNIDSATTPAGVPVMPSDLAAVALDTNSIQVTWRDNSSNEDEFELQKSLDGIVWTNLPAALPPANTSSHVDVGLVPGATRHYRIKARNSIQGDSAFDGPVNATIPTHVASFTAYNDLAWFAGQTNHNITVFTTSNSGIHSGWLVDYDTGNTLDVKLTVGGGGDSIEGQGAHPVPSTDADTVFGGRANCASTISYDNPNPMTLSFSGLNPTGTYEVVVYPDRGNAGYSNRIHDAAIGGADSFANDSTDGVIITSVTNINDTTVFNAGYNTTNGYVTRFTRIKPGSDGAFTITLRQDTAQNYYSYANAVMLKCPSDSGGDVLTGKIAKGATWRYARGTAKPSAPPTAWRGVDFVDSAWEEGPTPLGYKISTGGLATSLDDMQGNYSTVYMRRTFDVPNPDIVNRMTVRIDYDDGFILSLNAQEMARVNVAGTPGAFMTHTNFAASSGGVEAWSVTWDTASLPILLPGRNTIALQIFNGTLTSSDLYMNLALAVIDESYLDPADDADADGMNDAWETANCAGGDATPTNDVDLDGVTDAGEFVAGTHPTNPASVFAIEPTRQGDNLLVSFDALEATGPGYDGLGLSRHYALEECLDLQGNAWSIVPGYSDILGNNNTVTYTNSSPQDLTHYRARVWLE